jgi:hypothetical protein
MPSGLRPGQLSRSTSSHDGASVALNEADREALIDALGESYRLEIAEVRGRSWTVAAPVDLAA